ncbi:MAG: Do family serine endopeptidase [Verrucomicrobiota bacterium]
MKSMTKNIRDILWISTAAVFAVACQAQTESEISNETPVEIPIDETDIPRDALDLRLSYAPILAPATEAVVSVHTSQIIRRSPRGRNPMEEFLRRFYGLPSPQGSGDEPQERKMPSGVGSGVVIDGTGLILTNHHVITVDGNRDADEILVRLKDGREFEAEVIGKDRDTDVAVLKIEAEDLPSLSIASSDNLQVGDIVFAIGNPLGVGLTVTQGIVSATGRAELGIIGERSYENFIQTDASINPGNSGGALVDAKGRLVGINTAILSRSGGNIGIGFAIPSTLARNIALSLVNEGEIRRGFLGVSLEELTPDLAESFGAVTFKGALISAIQPESPADKAGLKRGDIVTKVNEAEIIGPDELRSRIASRLPGTEVDLSVVRDGKTVELGVTLGDLERFAQVSVTTMEFLDGVEADFLDEEVREEFGFEDDVNGILIRSVDAVSPYSRQLAAGMVVIEINGVAPKSIENAISLIKPGVNRFYMQANGSYGYLAIRVK